MENCIKLIAFLTLCVTINALEDCGSKVGHLLTVTVSGCPNLEDRCTLKRDTNVTLEMDFNTTQDIEEVNAIVHGVVLGVQIPFPLTNPNGCINCGLKCPLKSGGTYKYIATLPVEKKYPKVTVDVKWELKDKKDEDILCILIPAKIQ